MALAVQGTPDWFDSGGTLWNSNAMNDLALASGDFVLIGIAYYESNASQTWDTVTGFTNDGENLYSGSADVESYALAQYQELAGDIGAPTVSRSGQDVFGTACEIAFRGTNALTLDADGITYSSSGSGVTTIDAPSQSGSDGDALVCVFFLSDPPGTDTDPGTMTRVTGQPENTNNLHVFYEDLSATEATGTRTYSWTNSRDCIACSFLLNGASDPAGGGVVPQAAYYRKQQV